MTETDITPANDAFELLDPFVEAGRTSDCAVSTFDGVGSLFDNGAAAFENSEYRVSGYRECSDPAPLGSTRRVQRPDGTDARRLFDAEGRKVVTIALAQPTDPLPVYVAASKEALVGSRVQSASATDGALRVRIHPERVPFAVGDVFVNRGGADFVPCVRAQASEEDENAEKPVVAFEIDRDVSDRKELSFNVI